MADINVVSADYFAKVKVRLRTQSTAIDDEIETHIIAAREDLTRLGISADVAADETNMTVLAAVRAYTLWRFSSDAEVAERSRRDYYDMRDELRKHEAYRDDAG